MRKLILPLVLLTVIALRVAVLLRPSPPETLTITSRAIVIRESARCVRCHTKKTPGIVAAWRNSHHASAGIGCFECHGAKKGEPDAGKHFGELVSVIVSPKDCGRCHEAETRQFLASHHAKGGEVLGSLDNYLGEVVEGMGANVSGCQQCHGSTVKILKDGTLHPATWPNFGIGRINPDGTAGACSACHSRHDFSVAQGSAPIVPLSRSAVGDFHRGALPCPVASSQSLTALRSGSSFVSVHRHTRNRLPCASLR